MSRPTAPVSSSRSVPVFALAVLAAATLVSCWPFVAPGHPLTFDVWPHLARIKTVASAITDGHSPFYSFMFYSGYPMLRFYSPLFHLLGGALAVLAGGDPLVGLRVVLVVVQLLSSGAMFWFLRRRTGSTTAAAIGTTAYVLVPWRVRHIAVLANYPMALLYVLLPVAFLLLDRLLERPGRRTALVFGLVLALLGLFHVVYALYAVVFLLVAALVRSGRGRGFWPMAGAAAATAAGLGAFFLVPFAAEYRAHVFPGAMTRMPPLDPMVILGLDSQVSGYTGGYFGISVLVLVLAAAVLLLRWRRAKPVLGPAIGLVASLVAAFALPALGGGASVLTLGLLPERLLLFVLFFGVVIIAHAWCELETRLRGRRCLWLLLLVAAGLAADGAWHQVGISYFSPDRFLGAKRTIYRLLTQQGATRVLDLHIPSGDIDQPIRTQAYPGMGFVFGGLASPLGPHYHQFAPRSMAYVYPWVNAAAADLGDDGSREVSQDARAALFMLGVSHLIMEPVVVPFEQEGVTYDAALVKDGIGWDTRFVQPGRKPMLTFGATGAGFVLASLRTAPYGRERLVRDGEFVVASDWGRLLRKAGVDPASNTVAAIPVPAGNEPESLPGPVSVNVSEAEVGNDRVGLRVVSSGDCFLRLALSYYPWLSVRLDGEPARFGETAGHFIWLRFPAGEHKIEVTAPLTPVRRLTLVLSALALAGWIAGVATRRPRAGRGRA